MSSVIGCLFFYQEVELRFALNDCLNIKNLNLCKWIKKIDHRLTLVYAFKDDYRQQIQSIVHLRHAKYEIRSWTSGSKQFDTYCTRASYGALSLPELINMNVSQYTLHIIANCKVKQVSILPICVIIAWKSGVVCMLDCGPRLVAQEGDRCEKVSPWFYSPKVLVIEEPLFSVC